MERPLGVTLVAILTSLWGILAVAGAFEGFAFTALILRTGKRSGATEMIVLGMVSSIMALVFIRVTWGLLNLRKWARTVSIVFAAIWLVAGFAGLIADAVSKSWKYPGVLILGIAINLAAFFYLLRNRVKDCFSAAITL